MKLNKMKIARLTDEQSKSINGGGNAASTEKNFTCNWCTGGASFECKTTDFNNDPDCHRTRPSIN